MQDEQDTSGYHS